MMVLPTRVATVAIAAMLAMAEPASRERVPVLVELFTSEGCSSCPVADDALAHLIAQQPIAGIEIIGMSEHVDYWNRLGWTDPWSHARFSARQREYARAFGQSGVYTPQAVVDGRAEFVSADLARTVEAAAHAGLEPRATVTLGRTGRSSGGVSLTIRVQSPAGNPADVYLAITEDDLVSNVTRGENEGRRLAHAAVVRRLSSIGRATGPRPFTARPLVPIEPAWKPRSLHAVVFAQDPKTRAILGASTIPLGP